MNLSRRAFLRGTIGTAAVVAAAPRLLAVPHIWGDGVHDDTEALNTFLRGEPVTAADGIEIAPSTGRIVLRNGVCAANALLLVLAIIDLRAGRRQRREQLRREKLEPWWDQ